MERLVIIGGGPAGLSAAVYAGRALLGPTVVEGINPGGQLTETTEVENYPGFPEGILGPQLVTNMRLQAERFGAKFVTENVIGVVKEGSVFKTTLSNGEIIESETVLVATGASARWLGLESEQRLRNKGVSACATCDGFFFKGLTVAVVGGGDSAMEEATFLTKFATKVYLLHRRDQFRASKIMQERVKANPKIEILMNTEIIEVLGEESVSGLKLKDTVTGVEKTLDVQGLFLAIGHVPSTSFMKVSGADIDEQGYLYTSERVAFEKKDDIEQKFSPLYKYQTSIPGLFAAGDCVDKVYRQAATAVGMAIAAEIEIEKYLESIE